MRKVIFRLANSLDNYIARKDGSFDWILSSEETASAMTEFWNTIDAVVVGRKTYEPVLKSGTPFPTFQPRRLRRSRINRSAEERHITICWTGGAIARFAT